MAEYQRPLPKITQESKPFWEGCSAHELRMQRCSACHLFRFPPQKMCRMCNSLEAEWHALSGKGEVYSYIVPTRTSPGELPARGFEYPYVVALVELEGTGGMRIASNIIDCPYDQISIGMSVEVKFEQVSEGVTLPKFRRVQAVAKSTGD